MEIIFHSHANKTHFHKKGCAPSLILKVTVFGTRKWPINTLVFSKLFYCSSVWSNPADTNLLKLQAVQNFAAQIICGSRKFDHVTPLLKESALATYLISALSP